VSANEVADEHSSGGWARWERGVSAMSKVTSAMSDVSTSHLLASRLRLSMIHLSRQLRRHDPSELTIAQFSALATLVRSGPLGVGQLAEIEGLPSPAVTRVADRLEEVGLVARQANPADRRGVHLVATAKGTTLFERRAQVGDAWLTERLGRLSKIDRLALERAVALLESFATESKDGTPATTAEHHQSKEIRT